MPFRFLHFLFFISFAFGLSACGPGLCGLKDCSSGTSDSADNSTPNGNSPTVVSVSSTSSDGTYLAGSTVYIRITFSESVVVTGTPVLGLSTGNASQSANYSSGSGTSTLVFSYTIGSGAYSSLLDYSSTSALTLAGGSIASSSGTGATLTLPAPGAAGSLGANSAIQISARYQITGIFNTCARNGAGVTKCWGENNSGEAGQGHQNNIGDGGGEMGNSLAAIDLGTGRTALQIYTGKSGPGPNYSCALLDNSSVKCWGSNGNGELGQGHINALGDAAGEMGDNLPAIDLGTGRTAKELATGFAFACARLDDNSVKCWGSGANGQLGDGSAANVLGDAGGEMGDNLAVVNLGTGRTATAIASGGSHICALLDNSTLKCWGAGSVGQLGKGNANNLGDGGGEMGDLLTAIDLGSGRTATSISAGGAFSCAILDDQTTKCWGENGQGQLGLGDQNDRGDGGGEMGDSLPAVSLGTGRTATQLAVGMEFACALLDNGSVKCWGNNTYGQLGQGHMNALGDGGGEMGDNLSAIDLGTGRTAVQISAGWYHACAVLDNNTMKCWGRNHVGQLGQGDANDRGDGGGEMGDNLTAIDFGT